MHDVMLHFQPLSTRSDVLEFSKSRVGPLIEDNPFLLKLIRDTDTAGLKRVGNAHLYFRGMQSPVGMKSTPADMVIFDELDEATQPREVLLPPGAKTGLSQPSAVILNQIRSIDRRRLQKRLGTLDAATMRRVDEAIKISLGLVPL